MYLCDSNVWLALALSGHALHDAARVWLETVETQGSIAFCRATQQSLLRLLTHASVVTPYGIPPLSNDEAWSVCDAFLADDRIVFLGREPPGLESYWRRFAGRPTSSPKLWMDAYLSAFARASALRLVTTDAGFRQFADLDLLLLGHS